MKGLQIKLSWVTCIRSEWYDLVELLVPSRQSSLYRNHPHGYCCSTQPIQNHFSFPLIRIYPRHSFFSDPQTQQRSIQSQQLYPIASFLPIAQHNQLFFIYFHQFFSFFVFHSASSEKHKTPSYSYDEGKKEASRWAISRFVRPLLSRSQPPSLASDVLRRGSASVTASGPGSDIPGGIRVVAAGNIPGVDAVWICDVLHRVRVDAVGSGIGHALLRRRNPLHPLRLRPLHSLLRHLPTLAA